jgi:hypothetical protein
MRYEIKDSQVLFKDQADGKELLKVDRVNDEVRLESANLDMNQNEAQSFVLDKRTSDPSSPAVGQMWYRTDQD